jgi:para-nitrobenzyl esterase
MPGPIATTTHGRVQGAEQDGIKVFKGVPYAAPPVGANRFKPPQPLEPWSDVGDALAYGASCPQPAARPTGWSQEIDNSEDCLYLNVWTPALADGGSRPVMVWIHGGGYAIGSGSWPLYDGTALARRGDVVVVTVNHRLGPFGYLHLGGSTGNNGQLDLIASLEWVRDNIEAFGGDASNVTIFGESGGGAKISTLLAMPSSHGLFHRAAIQSGPGLRASTVEQAAKAAKRLMDEVGVTSVAELLDVPADRLVGAGGGLGPMGFGPVADGEVLPKFPTEALADGTAADVPVIVGCNLDEGAGALPQELDDAGLRERLEPFGPDHTDEILGVYRQAFPDASNIDVLSYAITDSFMRAGSIRLAEQKLKGGAAPVFMYLFTYPLGGRAGHGYEIQFVFDNVERLSSHVSDRRRAAAANMSDAWIAFARTGDPNHAALPQWPAYTVPDRATMLFGRDEFVIENDPSAATRELWRRLPPPPRGIGFRRPPPREAVTSG